MLGFQATINLGITAALLSILRRFRVHLGWSIPPLLILSVGEIRDWGMRPEALGILLLFWGVVFLLRRDRLGAFAAGSCLIGAGLVLQQAGIYSGLFFLVALGLSRPQESASKIVHSDKIGQLRETQEPSSQNWKGAALMIAGSIVPVLLFLQGIHWDLSGFLHVYSSTLQSAGGMEASRMNILLGYWISATVGWEWARLLVLMPLLLVVMVGFLMMQRSFERWLIGALLAGFLTNLLIVHTGSYRLSFLYFLAACAGFIFMGACKSCALWWRLALAFLCPTVFVALALPLLGSYFFHLPSNAEEVRQAVANQRGSAVYLDAFAASSVFDWRLPEKTQSLRDCKGYSLQNIFGKQLGDVPPRKGEIYIIEKSDYQGIPLRMLGRTWNSNNLNQWQWDVVDFQGKSLLTGKEVGFPGIVHPPG